MEPSAVMDDDATQDSGSFVIALARGLEVLQACAASPAGITLSDVARRTGHARASVRRSLLTLAATGYVLQDGRRFMLTPKVLSLGASLGPDSLPRLVQPVLDRLGAVLGESVSVATLDGPDILYIARAEARRIMGLNLTVGSRLPAIFTSMGRVLLAALPPEETASRLPMVLVARTPRTMTDRDALLSLLAEVRDDGYCIVDQELELGLRSLAVPIKDPTGQVCAALNVSTQAGRTTMRDLRRVMLPVLEAGAASLAPLLHVRA
ncbi:MAG: IclR family transcriptional regulator domain-containing protein [Janthinobacterium lividum]